MAGNWGDDPHTFFTYQPLSRRWSAPADLISHINAFYLQVRWTCQRRPGHETHTRCLSANGLWPIVGGVWCRRWELDPLLKPYEGCDLSACPRRYKRQTTLRSASAHIILQATRCKQFTYHVTGNPPHNCRRTSHITPQGRTIDTPFLLLRRKCEDGAQVVYYFVSFAIYQGYSTMFFWLPILVWRGEPPEPRNKKVSLIS